MLQCRDAGRGRGWGTPAQCPKRWSVFGEAMGHLLYVYFCIESCICVMDLYKKAKSFGRVNYREKSFKIHWCILNNYRTFIWEDQLLLWIWKSTRLCIMVICILWLDCSGSRLINWFITIVIYMYFFWLILYYIWCREINKNMQYSSKILYVSPLVIVRKHIIYLTDLCKLMHEVLSSHQRGKCDYKVIHWTTQTYAYSSANWASDFHHYVLVC